ncbi:hypothetical protein W822_19930 [Advenella kashmirensis W13003]|uniref:Phage abortive infection protein n=1 Tax=Advenella kashmirensis W13003 TaxID=1424334 RepID=V8QPJ9_9BURK|nr:hypothetical protein [Advenella kashmirensis]ETF00924.1 hypothetical protein W822_19930 [Advenella kashmirensis W13003]
MKKIKSILFNFGLLNLMWSGVAVTIATIAFFFYIFRTMPLEKDVTKWGAFGDYISGTAGTWISFITLIMVWITFLSQKRELEEQKNLNARQTIVMERQAFEQTFFSWIGHIKNIHRDSDINALFSDFRTQASESFENLVGYARNHRQDVNYKNQFSTNIASYISGIQDFYKRGQRLGNHRKSWLEQNIQNLETLVAFVDRADKYPATLEEKSIYFNILKAQYTNYERYVLGLEIMEVNNDILFTLTKFRFFDSEERHFIPKLIERRLRGKLTDEFIKEEINLRLGQ